MRRIQDFPSCIGFINGTLEQICKLWNNVMHQTWFNGRKKIYSMNIILVDNWDLFIYIDTKYPGSYHVVKYCNISISMPIGVTILPTWMNALNICLGTWATWVKKWWIGGCKLSLIMHLSTMKAYNKMHVGNNGVGHWGVQEQVVNVNEKVWLCQTQV